MSILKGKGEKIDDIPVKISYRIIELFSAGLYSSPNKAFEELVSNSYDAYATKVAVYIPVDKTDDDATIWVCDNGESMGVAGLKDLWKIGASPKLNIRNEESKGRLQIGKFGIGKLATYILTNLLTYVCKTKEGYVAVTMNYSEVGEKTEKLVLDEIKLEEGEAKELLSKYLIINGESMVPFNLFGEDAESSWTFTVLHNLKPKAADIQDGRLRWILSTALPLNPSFELFYNGAPLESSKVKNDPWKSWIIGDDDATIEKNKAFEEGEYNEKPCLNLESLKHVTGRFDLYRDSLLTGAKSERLGRSHGVFIMVRDRLINIDDPLFGMDALSHGVFNRIRITIHADGLDNYITSTREAIKEVQARKELVNYIKKKFQEIKDWYFSQTEAEAEKERASYKIAHASSAYSRRPLLIVAKRFFDGDISNLLLTKFPVNSTKEENEAIFKRMEKDLTSSEGIIRSVEWVILSPGEPIATFDILTGVASINSMHPFFANFMEEIRSVLPFKLIALTEILTEATLIEKGIDEFLVRDIMQRRDSILRELTFSDKPNAPLVATLLQSTVSDSTGLEDALAKAFSALGFETTPIGGTGTPDGLATANIDHGKSEKRYTFTYDAKSTKKSRIKAGTARVSGINRHREDYKADYALIVAVDFEGAEDPDSAVNKEAKSGKITLLRVIDLVRLVLFAGPKQLNLEKLRDLFETCHTVYESRNWIDALESIEVESAPFREILEVVHELSSSDLETPNVTAIRFSLKNRDSKYNEITSLKIKSILTSLETIVPNYVTLDGDDFSITTTPEIILKEINRISVDENIPTGFREMYMKAYGEKKG